MKKFIHEIHRRSLWQVLGIYLAGSWVALQVVEQLAEAAALPAWVRPFSLVLLVLGFPIVMATAFVQEGMTTRDPEPPKQSLADVGEVPPAPAPAPEGARKHFTWKRAVLGGVMAFLLLAVGIAAWAGMRSLGIGPAGTLVAKGVLEERDRILLADFANRTQDGQLGDVVTEALRVDLAQSDVVRLAEPSFVADALQRMERDPSSPLDEELARELARREGIKAVLAGDIGEAAGSYVLTARLVAPATGDILASGRESADEGDLIDAIDRISKRLRERVGESLQTLGADPPLERVTTADLAALERYTQAIRAIDLESDWPRGVALLEEAVAIDTAFAMAYRKLGQELVNRGQRLEDAYAALTRAYEHRDRLTETERTFTMASYFSEVAGDRDRAAQILENALDRDPTDERLINNLGAQYALSRQWARSEELFERAIALDSSRVFPYTNAALAKAAQGEVAEAAELLETLLARQPHLLMAEGYLVHAELQLGNEDRALELASHMVEDQTGNPIPSANLETFFGDVAAMHGELAEAERRYREAERIRRRDVGTAQALWSALDVVEIDLFVREDRDRAAERLGRALDAYPLEEIATADRPYPWVTSLLARTGQVSRARELYGEWEGTLGETARRREAPGLDRARGSIALAANRYDEAIELLRRSDVGDCQVCAL
ncbi:MAG: hypothetical protein R3266_07845, partial [Gemmatimonadota bacterium]|nr:hypothetical protein [Gemmatimonadota bacterium]